MKKIREIWACENCGRPQEAHRNPHKVYYANIIKKVCRKCKHKRVKMFGNEVLVNSVSSMD